MNRIALVCIAKDEDRYIDEWIEYNLKLGFSGIYIYGNDWIYSGKYINYNRIYFEKYNREINQTYIYNKFINEKSSSYDYAAFIDVDEFIVLKNNKVNISDFIDDFSKYPGIVLNWNIIGSCNKEFDENYSVLERFTRCSNNLSSIYKTIINLKEFNINMIDAHTCNMFTKCVNVCYDLVNQQRYCFDNLNECRKIAYINHYLTKTKYEFIKKINRGIGYFYNENMIKNRLNQFDEYSSNEYNEVEDMSALNFIKTGKFI